MLHINERIINSPYAKLLLRSSNELRKRGIFVSPSGARSIWLRHHLESFKKRLSALEKKSAEEGLVLTESQVAALERKKDDDLVRSFALVRDSLK